MADFWSVLVSNMQTYGVDKATEMLKQGKTTPNNQVNGESIFTSMKTGDGDVFIHSQKTSEE